MNDDNLADQVREIAEKMHYHANRDNVRGSEEEYIRFFARQLDELTPAPPTLADMHPAEVGDVIESADDPRLAALPEGSILLDRDADATIKREEYWMGDGYIPIPSEGDKFGPWNVLHIGREADQ